MESSGGLESLRATRRKDGKRRQESQKAEDRDAERSEVWSVRLCF